MSTSPFQITNGKVKGKEGIASRRKNAALILLSSRDENTEKSFRNFGQVLVEQVKDVNPVELLSYKYVVVANPKESLETLGKRIKQGGSAKKEVAKVAPKTAKKVAKKTVKKTAKKVEK